MATFPYNRKSYNTICLNKIIVKCTQVINVIMTKLILYLVKIIFTYIFFIYILISRKLYDVINHKGSSETTCVYSCLDLHHCGPKIRGLKVVVLNHPPRLMGGNNIIIEDKINVNNNDPDFIYWLAGLIDGDGSLLINKNKALTCEITVHERDVKALFNIKEKYHGSVLKRSNVKAYRWRVSKKWIIYKLYSDLNGKLITDGKIKQIKNCSKTLPGV